ncbi:hypothetical protein CPBP_00585 [Candidatus Bodocaedibacter vickermanii]|uniref:Uncharacterized protein n=1 Tax=Candidatus Bodocaedibacter vickermanii TaxID=2741701 RepID=A0A7L9RTC5_9PROT|nr:hypothetical protein CPBP_00585 [Candidatus Paracaedibacteraceae bacterium 'Lake Konstanz']
MHWQTQAVQFKRTLLAGAGTVAAITSAGRIVSVRHGTITTIAKHIIINKNLFLLNIIIFLFLQFLLLSKVR